jgi:hypothetical protein
VRKTIVLTVLLALGVSLSYAQGIIKVKVVEEKTKEPLVGASATIVNNGKQATTDANGNFIYEKMDTGNYVLEVFLLGFERNLQHINVGNDSVTIVIEMSKGAIQLQDVIISATTDRPINTLSPVDINLRPTNTSQDILRMVPGLFIAQHAGGGKAEQIFLRGFDIDHGTDINLSVDGLPVNMVSHAHGQGYADLHFVIPELISYVDFDKGPYFADKGDFATAGYVEFQTKNYLDKNFASTEIGQYGMWRNVAGINFCSPEHRRSSGYFVSEIFKSNGYFESPQDLNRLNLTSKFNSRFTSNDNLTVSASYFRSLWDASGQIPERAVHSGLITRFGHIDNTEGGETSRSSLSLRYVHQFMDGAYLEQQFYGIYYDFNLFSNFTFFLNDPIYGDQINQRESRQIYGYRTAYNATGTIFDKIIKTEAGMGFRADDVKDIALSNAFKRHVRNDKQLGNIHQWNINGYVNETIIISDQWSLTAGIRIDDFYFSYGDKINEISKSYNKTIVSPKVNVNYKWNDKVQLYLRTGLGFHSNDARVVTSDLGEDILPRALGIDLGAIAKLNEKLLINSAIWRLDMQQEFVYVGDEGIVEAGGKTKRVGIDFSVRCQVASWLFIDGDINATKPKFKNAAEGNDFIPLAPLLSSAGGLTVRMKNGFGGSLRYRYLGDRPANEDYSITAKGYSLADAIINFLRPRFEVALSVENIFNKKWKEAQFDVESRLENESRSTSEIHFTPGTPLFIKLRLTYYFNNLFARKAASPRSANLFIP